MKENRLLKISALFFVSLIVFGCSSIRINEVQRRFILENKGEKKYFLIEYINKNRNLIGEMPTLIINKKDEKKTQSYQSYYIYIKS